MPLTFGPKKYDVVPNASQVKVFIRGTSNLASLSSPVQITSDGSVTFTVSAQGHYTVVIATTQVITTENVYLTEKASYDITDPRSYANTAPGVAGGSSGATGDVTALQAAVASLNSALASKANASDVVKTVNGTAPAGDGNVVVAVSAGSVGSSGITDASTLGRSVLTAANAAAARTAIGAGTSNLVVGTASTDAKAGDYQPTSTNISDATATGRSVLTAVSAATARTALGAGTSSLVVGTGAGTAAGATTVVTLTGAQSVAGVKTFTNSPVVPDASFVIAKITGLQAALDAKGTSNLAIGTTGSTAKAGNWVPTSTDISDATATGRSLLTSASVSAARTLLGALDQTAVDARIQAIIDAAPGTLDTLNELAAALGDNPDFAASITSELALKANAADVVTNNTNQTIAGIKTFTSAPVVPDASLTIAKIASLQAALDAKATSAHTHAATGISDSTTVGRAVVTAASAGDARTAIGAGTSNLAIGTSAGTAAEGNTVVAVSGDQTVGGVKTFSDAPVVPDNAFAISKISTLQSIIDSKAAISHTQAASTISDSTTVGRAVLTAADAATARTAIGAGTSSLALGSTSSTAAAGDTVVTLSGNQTVSGTKTFSAAPAVPDNSFATSKINGLTSAVQTVTNSQVRRLVIEATAANTWPVRATWIAANAPGFTGRIEWDHSNYGLVSTLPATMATNDWVVDEVAA